MERAPPNIATEQRCNDESGEGHEALRVPNERLQQMWSAIRGGAWSELDDEVQSTADVVRGRTRVCAHLDEVAGFARRIA